MEEWVLFRCSIACKILCLLNLRFLTPTKDNLDLAYSEFTTLLKAAAKDSIPCGYRKSYIPNWDTECEKRYKAYLQSEGTSELQKNAAALFDYLDSKRHERWIDTITSIDFTHSSRKAWRTLNKITGRETTPKKCPVPPNQFAKQLQDNGRYPNANRKFAKAILKESVELKNKNTHSDHHHLENDITTPEVSFANKSLKLGKAPGLDGIHNEFIKNCGTKLVHWLNEFINIQHVVAIYGSQSSGVTLMLLVFSNQANLKPLLEATGQFPYCAQHTNCWNEYS